MVYIIIGIAALILDIVTKHWAVTNIMGTNGVPIIEDIFHLTYLENRGVAFGMMQDMRAVFVTMSIIVLFILALYFYRVRNKNVWLKLGTALIYSGSIGNMIERVTKGYVVDFLDFRIINFPIFNIADIAVCIGAGALIIHFIFFADNDNKKNEENLTDNIVHDDKVTRKISDISEDRTKELKTNK